MNENEKHLLETRHKSTYIIIIILIRMAGKGREVGGGGNNSYTGTIAASYTRKVAGKFSSHEALRNLYFH